MPKEHLDHANIDTVLEQMRREAVTQRMRADALGDPSGTSCFFDDPAQLARGNRPDGVLAREQPSTGQHGPLATSFLPPRSQQSEEIGRKHRIAIPPALAALDADQHALAVDIADLECGDLSDPKAGTIGNTQCGAVLEAGGRCQEPGDLVLAQHHWKLAGIGNAEQLA